jgi:hypothetical protein
MTDITERIAGVAIRMTDRMFVSMPAPARHGDLISELCLCGASEYAHNEQGFVTDTGRYVTRRQAKRIAFEAGQLKGDVVNHHDLFSEDVW